MQKKISIIIPCYNVEQYVWDCYLSLKRQTFGVGHLELIFVDDGSKDGTWQKLNEVERDCPDSVMIIHCEENGRLGTARNIGLTYASAPFVAFVDSDDWVEPDMYEKLYNKAVKHGCDVVCCGFIRDLGGPPVEGGDVSAPAALTEGGNAPAPAALHGPAAGRGKNDRLLLVDGVEKRKQFILAGSMGYYAWNKLLRKELITKNGLYFPEKLVYEDNYWGSALYLYAGRIYILDEKLYHYRVNFQSIVLAKEQPYYRDFLAVNLLKWQEWENRGLLLDYYRELTIDFLITCYLGYLKLLILRFRRPSFEDFLILKREVLARVPDYAGNPYLTSHFTPFNQLLLNLLKLPVTRDVFEQVTIKAKVNWQDVRIFVATHVKFSLPDDTIYQPIHVGRAAGGDLGYPGDDTGDNISALNKYYGELTGLYWIWKNYHASDYVGLCHYRRYFVQSHKLLDKEGYIRLLMEYDVIVSKPIHHDINYYEMYEKAHNIEDLLAVEEAIGKLSPEYLPDYREVVWGKDSYVGNLFVAAKSTWDAYCEWLFKIFKEASPKIRPDTYDSYHRRVYGFMSEQLLLVWVKANGLSWYGCSFGLTQEKAESITLKEYMYSKLTDREFGEALDYCRGYLKERPDVVLMVSDINKEIPLLLQLLKIGQGNPDTALIRKDDTQETMLERYRRVLEIMANLEGGRVKEGDRIFIRENGISTGDLKVIMETTPSYQGLDVEKLY
jgi:glycosyltransferase involved in cell wall biosynthesis